MIAVIFEVWPASEREEDYLALAGQLRPLLDSHDGFISIERFRSLADSGKLLSLSFWRDEAAVQAWRNHEAHCLAQGAGRGGILHDYRIRIAAVSRDYSFNDRAQAPADSVARWG